METNLRSPVSPPFLKGGKGGFYLRGCHYRFRSDLEGRLEVEVFFFPFPTCRFT